MTIEHVLFEGDPSRIPPLSLATAAHDLLFISGTPGYDSDFHLSESFPEQLRLTFERLHVTLARAGLSPQQVLKTTVFLTRAVDLAEMNRQYAEFFGVPPYPARTTCVVLALPDPKMLVEIECVAAYPTRR